jgi:hypothetical protein
MLPSIYSGDRIILSPDKEPTLKDIIVFRRDNALVCHRLVRVFQVDGIKYYQTRGDSFFGLDEPVTSGQILGKVTKIERKNVSFARRILLLLHPILKFGRINAFVIMALIKLRALFPSSKSH